MKARINNLIQKFAKEGRTLSENTNRTPIEEQRLLVVREIVEILNELRR
jgi:hypothetical protein